MLVNKKKTGLKKKFVALALGTALIVTAGAAYADVNAVKKTARLDGSSAGERTERIYGTSSSGYKGSIVTANTGANTTVRGYAKKHGALIDTTVADTGWLNPGNSVKKVFTQEKSKYYYGEISGQTIGSRGYTEITVYSDY